MFEVLFHTYGLRMGQRWYSTLPVSMEAVCTGWESGVGDVVRAELDACRQHADQPVMLDPVLLCWRSRPGYQTDALDQPRVWVAWGPDTLTKAYDELGYGLGGVPGWAAEADAYLLMLETGDALRACDAWPKPTWYYHWLPGAMARSAARDSGITARFFGGPWDGRVERIRGVFPRFQTSADPAHTYTRDPEPIAVHDDGTALWGFRYDGD